MTSINDAPKQQVNRIHESKRGSFGKYHAGYLDALKAVAKCLGAQANEQSLRPIDSGLVNSCLSALTLDLKAKIRSGKEFEKYCRLSPQTKLFFETAAEIVRQSGGDPEFVDWWLREYGIRMLAPDSDRNSPLFPDTPAPRTEAELNLLEAKLDHCVTTLETHRYLKQTHCSWPRSQSTR